MASFQGVTIGLQDVTLRREIFTQYIIVSPIALLPASLSVVPDQRIAINWGHYTNFREFEQQRGSTVHKYIIESRGDVMLALTCVRAGL